jgi:hypothetical protein
MAVSLPCCCTIGHRCPWAWQLIILAQQARARRQISILDQARRDYCTHLQDAGALPRGPGVSSMPDLCTITMAEDPRCPQCPPLREGTHHD